MTTETYHALHQHAGYTTLADQSVLAISGRHRTRWLHGMITQDVNGLSPGEGRYGCVVNIKGKVQHDFQLFNDHDGEQLMLIMDASRISPMVEALRKYIVAERITFDEHMGKTTIVTVQGPAAAEVLGHPQADITLADWAGVSLRIARHRRGPHDGYDLLVPSDDVDSVITKLTVQGAVAVSGDDLEIVRIEAAIPRYGVDVDDTIIPLEACMLDAIHWEKGCYVGQEVLARMFHRGHTNKELRQLMISGDSLPEVGAEIFPSPEGGKACGTITSSAFSPQRESILALGYVRRKHFDPGTALHVSVAGGLVDAQVTSQTIRAPFGE